jgi:hypothetical protein
MVRKNSNDWQWRHNRVGGLQKENQIILKTKEMATAAANDNNNIDYKNYSYRRNNEDSDD